MRSAPRSLFVLVLFAVLGGACGGGSGVFYEEFDRTYTSLEARDGFVTSAGTFGTVGGGAGVGDIDGIVNGVMGRMYFSFETGGISSGSEILSAVLRVHAEGVTGDPYGKLGNMVVDHLEIGPDLDASDYSGGTIASNLGAISTSASLGYKTLDVTGAVQVDVDAGRARSEFRVYFETDTTGDGTSDLVPLNDGGDQYGSGNLPELFVRYRAPRL